MVPVDQGLVEAPVGHGLGVVVGDAILVVQGDVGARARVFGHGVNLTTTSNQHLLPTPKKQNACQFFDFRTKVTSLEGASLGPPNLTCVLNERVSIGNFPR